MLDFIQRLLLNLTGYCSKMISKIYMPGAHKKIYSSDYRAVQPLMKPGMTMLSYTRGELSNMFIPGDWAHAAIVKDSTTVIEATTHGVIETDLIDFMMKKDYVILLEPLFADDEERLEVVKVAMLQKGKGYNYKMRYQQSNIMSFYCSELNYYCYMEACKESPFTLREILGVQTVIPGDFANAKDKFRMLWLSATR